MQEALKCMESDKEALEAEVMENAVEIEKL